MIKAKQILFVLQKRPYVESFWETVISQINMIMNSDLPSDGKIFVLRDIILLTEY